MTPSTDKNLTHDTARMSEAAAGLLTLLCGLVFATGVSQQTFERFLLPADYARALLAQAGPLRLIVAIDDVFIVVYVAATLLLCTSLRERATKTLLSVVLSAAVLGGLLDLLENHHILAMLRQAEYGLLPSSAEIAAQVVASSFKWMLGHAAFALLAFALDVPGSVGKLVRASLLWVQLPLGAATLVVVQPYWLEALTWCRYGNVLIGFVGMSLIMRGASPRSSAYDAAGSGAPA